MGITRSRSILGILPDQKPVRQNDKGIDGMGDHRTTRHSSTSFIIQLDDASV